MHKGLLVHMRLCADPMHPACGVPPAHISNALLHAGDFLWACGCILVLTMLFESFIEGSLFCLVIKLCSSTAYLVHGQSSE